MVLNLIVYVDDVFVLVSISPHFFMPATDRSDWLAVEHPIVAKTPINSTNSEPFPL